MGQRQIADLSVFGRIKFITMQAKYQRLNANTLYVAAILFSRSTLHRETLPCLPNKLQYLQTIYMVLDKCGIMHGHHACSVAQTHACVSPYKFSVCMHNYTCSLSLMIWVCFRLLHMHHAVG